MIPKVTFVNGVNEACNLLLNPFRDPFIMCAWGKALPRRLACVNTLAADFDGTLTVGQSHSQIMDEMLPEPFRTEARQLLDLFINGAMREGEPAPGSAWAERDVHPGTLDLSILATEHWRRLCRAQISTELFHTAAEQVKVKPGTKQLLEMFDHRVVISIGDAPVISQVLNREGLTGIPIFATHFKLDDGKVIEFDPVSLVLDTSKGHALRAFLHAVRVEDQSRVLVLGDSAYDRKMFLPNTVNGLVASPSSHSIRGDAGFLQRLWKRLDFIYVGDDLEPLANFIKHHQGGQHG